MAFQIVDDVLDVVATDEELGKPAGHDLVEGVYTLPVIRALNGPDGAELRVTARRPAQRRRPTARPATWCAPTRARCRPSITDARAYADKAIAALGPDADSEAGTWLVATANGLLEKVEAAL